MVEGDNPMKYTHIKARKAANGLMHYLPGNLPFIEKLRNITCFGKKKTFKMLKYSTGSSAREGTVFGWGGFCSCPSLRTAPAAPVQAGKCQQPLLTRWDLEWVLLLWNFPGTQKLQRFSLSPTFHYVILSLLRSLESQNSLLRCGVTLSHILSLKVEVSSP